MKTEERIFIILILTVIIIAVMVDLIADFNEGAAFWHLFIEGIIGLFAMLGVLLLTYKSLKIRTSLNHEKHQVKLLQAETNKWRQQLKKHIHGLSDSIHQQMDYWKLTPSEREIAFMLLKGLSIKEIAKIRSTSEKTTRTQCASIYEKSDLSGRSELSAFFLEDLFNHT